MRVKVLCLCGTAADRSVVAALTGLQEVGVDLTVALPLSAPARQPLAASGVRLLDDKLCQNVDPKSVRRLQREIKTHGYQIVHVLSDSALRSALLAVRNLDVKLVVQCHSVGSFRWNKPSSWFGLPSSRVNGVICETDELRRRLASTARNWGRARRRLPVTIYQGFDPKWFASAGADLEIPGIPDDAFVVSCLAGDIPPSGSGWLSRTMKLLSELENLHFLLIGPANRTTLSELETVGPIARRVHQISTPADRLSYIARSDTFVMPFASSDSLSGSLLGAMACGVPVVAARRGWSAEFVADGESGIVVQADNDRLIADAIRSLHDDKELRERFSRAAQERVRRQFTVEGSVTKTFQLYRELLSPGW